MKKIKIILFCFIITAAAACTSKGGDPEVHRISGQREQNEDTITAKRTSFGSADSIEGVRKFIDKYKDSFADNRLDNFDEPDYDMLRMYDLTKVDSADVPEKVFDLASLDSYNASVYLFSLENRLENFQDFTLYITNEYSSNIVYCVLDSNNNVISALNLAYQFAEGEYSEYASGEFAEHNEYHQVITGMGDAWEEEDGTITEGTETESRKYFRIEETGEIYEI